MFWVNFWKRVLTNPFSFVFIIILVSLMAIINKGILGGFKGKLGNLVGSERSGNDTIANYREGSTINWSVQTDNERTRMNKLCYWASKLPMDFFNTFYPIKRKYCNSYFTFIHDNYQHTTAANGFTPTADMILRYKMSKNVFPIFGAYRTTGAATVSWSSLLKWGNQQNSDKCSIIVWVPSNGYMFYNKNLGTRSPSLYNFTLPPLAFGTPYTMIIIFRSADGKLTGNAMVFNGTVRNP